MKNMESEQGSQTKCIEKSEEKGDDTSNNNSQVKKITEIPDKDEKSAIVNPNKDKVKKKAKKKAIKEGEIQIVAKEEKSKSEIDEEGIVSTDKNAEATKQEDNIISNTISKTEKKMTSSESDSAIKVSKKDEKAASVKGSTHSTKATKKKPNSTGNLHKKDTKSTGRNKIKRNVQDNEHPEPQQTKLTQHFPVRRSERRVNAASKVEKEKMLEDAILNKSEEGLEVRNIEEKGRGVFSTKKFLKGDLICEYAGELIDYNIAKEREAHYLQNPDIGSYMYFFCYKDRKYCVDATKESDRLGRLLNHSKTKSNVCTKLHPINSIPRLILLAAQDIEAGEELVYDYGDRSKDSLESHPWLKM